MTNVLLIATGSVAAIRTGRLAEEIRAEGHNIRLVHTAAAKNFLEAERKLPPWLEVYNDDGEWQMWKKLGDPVQHIELRNWASILVIAPLDANTLAKIANGLCDNLATCIARAWPIGVKPMLIVPAMNTAMWEHPITDTHLCTLRSWGINVLDPVVKILACGDKGVGAMAARVDTVKIIQSLLGNKQ